MTNDNRGAKPRAQSAHPSSGWTCVLNDDPDGPRDPDRFRQAMQHPGYPCSSVYDPAWVYRNLMGPNCLWLVEDLAARAGIAAGDRVLDLGCGAALTSIFLARELGAEVWAADLWVAPDGNLARIREAGVADRVFPLAAEAHRLPFAQGFFDSVLSVDAYHYFGTEVRYLSYLAQFVRPGGTVAIAVPGNAVDPDDPEAAPVPVDVFAEAGADWFTFRSAGWWRRHWSRTRGIVVEEAAMIEDGRAQWERHLEAAEAWSGVPAAGTFDGRLLGSPAGRTLGFCRVIARRGEERPLRFGPGAFETRIS
jgi:SAM-dependent methyltransferase